MTQLAADATLKTTSREKGKSLGQRIAKNWFCYVWIVPTFLLLLLFNYYPAASALYHSFFNWNGANIKQFIGIDNFTKLLSDSTFWLSMRNMIKLTIASVAINLTFPLAAASLIFHLKNLRMAYGYRVIFVIPMVVPGVVTLMIWKFIYSPNIGVINQFLTGAGLEQFTRPWLGDFKLALYAIIFIGFPWIAGIGTLIYLAGFQAIPEELLDASAIDGASTWGRFFKIELPLVASQIKLLVILTVIGAFQGFATILIMTNGGPGTTTMVPGLYLYRNAMYYNKMGYACALGTVIFVITLVLTYINTRYLKSSVEFTGA